MWSQYIFSLFLYWLGRKTERDVHCFSRRHTGIKSGCTSLLSRCPASKKNYCFQKWLSSLTIQAPPSFSTREGGGGSRLFISQSMQQTNLTLCLSSGWGSWFCFIFHLGFAEKYTLSLWYAQKLQGGKSHKNSWQVSHAKICSQWGEGGACSVV